MGHTGIPGSYLIKLEDVFRTIVCMCVIGMCRIFDSYSLRGRIMVIVGLASIT